MRFGKFWQVIPVGVWVPWFAWRPVWDGHRYIWLERVEFKDTYIGGAFGEHVYRTEWRALPSPQASTGSAPEPSSIDQHEWQEMTFGKKSGLTLTCCTKCGYVKRNDGKPNKPCKGRLAVVVRDPQS